MATKSSIPTNGELLNKLLHGGPRQRRDAGAEFHRRACAGVDLASHMPDPGTLGDPNLRHSVLGILSICHCNEDRFEEYLDLLQHLKLESALLDWGNFVPLRAPRFVPLLMPLVLEHLASADADRMKAAGYPIAMWGQKGIDLWAWAEQLLPLLGKENSVVIGLAHAYDKAQVKPSLDAVSRLLDSKDARLCLGASALLAHIAVLQSDFSRLLPLVTHSNASVRKGASATISESSRRVGVGRRFMALTIDLEDRRGRETIANAVTVGFESHHKMTPEAKELQKQLQSANATDRASAAERAAGLSIDAIDCRGLATLLAQALFDEHAEVRAVAPLTLYYLADMQAPVYVVQATLPCLEAARKTASREQAEHLQKAIELLARAEEKTPGHIR